MPLEKKTVKEVLVMGFTRALIEGRVDKKLLAVISYFYFIMNFNFGLIADLVLVGEEVKDYI